MCLFVWCSVLVYVCWCSGFVLVFDIRCYYILLLYIILYIHYYIIYYTILYYTLIIYLYYYILYIYYTLPFLYLLFLFPSSDLFLSLPLLSSSSHSFYTCRYLHILIYILPLLISSLPNIPSSIPILFYSSSFLPNHPILLSFIPISFILSLG